MARECENVREVREKHGFGPVNSREFDVGQAGGVVKIVASDGDEHNARVLYFVLYGGLLQLRPKLTAGKSVDAEVFVDYGAALAAVVSGNVAREPSSRLISESMGQGVPQD